MQTAEEPRTDYLVKEILKRSGPRVQAFHPTSIWTKNIKEMSYIIGALLWSSVAI